MHSEVAEAGYQAGSLNHKKYTSAVASHRCCDHIRIPRRCTRSKSLAATAPSCRLSKAGRPWLMAGNLAMASFSPGSQRAAFGAQLFHCLEEGRPIKAWLSDFGSRLCAFCAPGHVPIKAPELLKRFQVAEFAYFRPPFPRRASEALCTAVGAKVCCRTVWRGFPGAATRLSAYAFYGLGVLVHDGLQVSQDTAPTAASFAQGRRASPAVPESQRGHSARNFSTACKKEGESSHFLLMSEARSSAIPSTALPVFTWKTTRAGTG